MGKIPAEQLSDHPEGGQNDPAEGAVGQSSGDPAGANEDEALGEPGLKALHAEREANKASKRQIAELEAKVKAFEDANLTDAEKRDREIGELRGTNSQLSTTVQRYEACAAAGLDLSFAKRLAGGDLDELTEDAKSLKVQLGARPGIPKPDPSTGLTSHGDVGSTVSAGRDLFNNRHHSKE